MTLRTQLKRVKMQMSKGIQYYFTRSFQIKEELEAITDNVKEEEVEMTTLNGLPISWEYFIQGFCSIRKLTYGGMHIRRSLIDRKRRRDREYENQAKTRNKKKEGFD